MRTCALILTLAATTSLFAQSTPTYRVTQTYALGGDGSCVIPDPPNLTPQGSRNMGLDPTNHRVFIVSAKFGPAPAGARGRGPVLPGSFTLMVIEREPAAR
jgi:hypothetical protein